MKQVINEIANRFIEESPIGILYSQFLGITRVMGKVPDFSEAGVAKRMIQAKQDLDTLNQMAVTRDNVSKEEYLEYRLMKSKLEYEIFEMEEHNEFKESVMPFVFPLQIIGEVYSSRSYAPINERIRHIIQVEEKAGQLIDWALNSLNESCPLPQVQVGVIMVNGLTAFLQDELIEFVTQSDDEELIEKWSQVNQEAIRHLNRLSQALLNQYMPRANTDYAKGEELYLNILKYEELLEIDLQTLKKVAMKDLERNRKTLEAILAEKGEGFLEETMSDYPTAANLLDEARASTERAKAFIIEKDLITLPPGADPVIKETPKSDRAVTLAAMNTSDIAEDTGATESYYYVTPPDPTWSEEQTQGFLRDFNIGTLDAISIHEVWPGHHLHLLHVKQLQSKIIRQVGFSTTTIEGWAHYTEEMAVEEGYDKYDPKKFHIGQLKMALMRNCRFVASIGMHTEDMSVEEAQKLFMDNAIMGSETAFMEAQRGAIQPMYLNYTLGKLMILKLREDYKKEKEGKGETFSLKEFHDEFMKYGGLPVTLIREVMLENPNTNLL